MTAGWKRVRVVTDHGWLLVPGGLPKTDLPGALTDNRWGRCAALKTGAISEERLFPWYWNSSQYFALADGVSCFRKGEEYTHGGLSLQECLTLHLTVTPSEAVHAAAAIELTDVAWKGLRCTVAAPGGEVIYDAPMPLTDGGDGYWYGTPVLLQGVRKWDHSDPAL